MNIRYLGAITEYPSTIVFLRRHPLKNIRLINLYNKLSYARYDLLEDRCIDDNSTDDSAIATNHFASFCIDNRLRQSVIFVYVKLAKFEIKRLFFRIF